MSLTRVTRFALTHAHQDHIGGLDALAAQLPSTTWHRPTALESARVLRALDPPRLAVGHGKIVDAPGAAMDAAIARGG